MRKVRAKFWDYDRKQWITTEGLFHTWGYEELQSGGNYSVGIVELPGGRIVTPLPTDIHFLEGADNDKP